MKRFFLQLFFTLGFMLLICIPAFAYTPQTAEIGIYNPLACTYDYQSYALVSLTNKGEPVDTDMPAFISDGRTLVPVRVISEGLGADVQWLEQTQQVVVDYGDLSVVLTIGSDEAVVNGSAVTLPDGVPAMLAEYKGAERTLVPLRFVAETLGAKVEWDAETYTVHIDKPEEPPTAAQVLALEADGSGGLTVCTDGKADYKVKYYGGKLIIDILNAVPGADFDVSKADGFWLADVRYSRYKGYSDTENVVRIVFNLSDGYAYPDNIAVESGTNGIRIFAQKTDDPDTEPSAFTVIIDAGHGGNDPGAMADGCLESQINLDVALRVRDLLEAEGFEVLMTRTDDRYISMSERAEIANESGADIFVSIHTNASEESLSASGIETYCLAPGGWAEVLSGFIQDEVTKETGAADRGVKTANYYVLRETVMPAALVEIGFITTESERELLLDESYQDELAAGIAGGIMAYFKAQ